MCLNGALVCSPSHCGFCREVRTQLSHLIIPLYNYVMQCGQSSHLYLMMRHDHKHMPIMIHCHSTTTWQQEVSLINQTFTHFRRFIWFIWNLVSMVSRPLWCNIVQSCNETLLLKQKKMFSAVKLLILSNSIISRFMHLPLYAMRGGSKYTQTQNNNIHPQHLLMLHSVLGPVDHYLQL